MGKKTLILKSGVTIEYEPYHDNPYYRGGGKVYAYKDNEFHFTASGLDAEVFLRGGEVAQSHLDLKGLQLIVTEDEAKKVTTFLELEPES